MLQLPSRGEVWHASFEPVQGREQGRDRPCLVVSIDSLNHGPGDLVVVAPITTTQRNTPFHVPVEPPEGGLSERSFIMCEQVRALSVERLHSGPVMKRYGSVSRSVLRDVEDRLRIILNL